VKAKEILDHFRQVGTWVDWDHTVDEFLHGSPDAEVQGIATCWIPTNIALDRAASAGCNLVITHEPAFCAKYADEASTQALVRQKREIMDQYGITLLRCHDTWDRMPVVGIPDAWAEFLDLPSQPRQVESFYKVCDVEGLTAGQLAEHILKRVRDLGQDTVLVLGNPSKSVSRMAVGTGAITHLPSMYELGADVILATDDGMNSWTGGLWAMDLGLPLLIVNHATAEKPGMMAMARYLGEQFEGVTCQYVDVDIPYSSVH
jgi:putative NIF3 family GTP cyclohydrolase 1 type 2